MTTRIAFADVEDDRVLAAVHELVHIDKSITAVLANNVEHAAELTADGEVAAGIAGSLSASADVIRAGIKKIGVAQPGGFACGCFFMHFDDHSAQAARAGHVFTYVDPAVIPDPNAEQLATIAIAGADAHRLLTGEEPKVAMLSFSTLGSATHSGVDKVRDAVKIVRDRRPDVLVDGEFQFDVAVDAEVAARKCPGSPVAGNANVFVFPNLDAGNIAYKITERLAGVRAVGSFVLGLRRPWIDLSRGCSVDDIVAAAQAAVRLADQKVSA
jgi:phosphate acetyltransferase